MSLNNKVLQIMDTCDAYFIQNGVTLFSGATSQTELSQKTDKVEIFSGIGNNKVMSMVRLVVNRNINLI